MYAQRCRKRGCRIINGDIYCIWDRENDNDNHGTRNDIPKILSFVDISLDKELEKKRQMEKMDIETIGIMLYMSSILCGINSKCNTDDTI